MNPDSIRCRIHEYTDRAQFRIWRDRMFADQEPCPPGMGYETKVCGTHRKRWSDWSFVIGIERLPQ